MFIEIVFIEKFILFLGHPVYSFSIILFSLLVFLPGVIGGVYLLRRQSWARILLIVVGVLNLPGLPLGTALGIYTIWVLSRPEATREVASATGS